MHKKACFGATLIVLLSLIMGNWRAQAAPSIQAPPVPQDPIPQRPLYDPEQVYLKARPVNQPTGPQAQQTPQAPQYTRWNWFSYQSYRNGAWNIYTYDWEINHESQLTRDRTNVEARISRDCTKIVFSRNSPSKYNIFTMAEDGSNLKQLTSTGNNHNPAWSPDGQRIAFESDRAGQYEIFVMNADGTGQTRLTYSSDYDGQPTWSPDGSMIIFSSRRAGLYRIYVMNANGSGLIQLSNQSYSARPYWSPDGSTIAYDSDGNGDGWQELWLMNADGSNQRQLYKPSTPLTDAYAAAFSPGGQSVSYTEVTWIQYNGSWYWNRSFVGARATNSYASSIAMDNLSTRDWLPDWQSPDRQPPQTTMEALPAVSPSTFYIRWKFDDHDGSGVSVFFLDMRDGADGAWVALVDQYTFWGSVIPTQTYIEGQKGHTYYFRMRAVDKASNIEPFPEDYDAVTTVDPYPPVTSVTPLEEYSRGVFTVYWGGFDPGDSGITDYDVQYKDGIDGEWTDWMIDQPITSHDFYGGQEGHTYYFRSRGTDASLNQEEWPAAAEGDAHTTLYGWKASGRVTDNRDVPLQGVQAQVSPGGLGGTTSNTQGLFSSYALTSTENLSLDLEKSGYGSGAAYTFAPDQDGQVDAVMPPANDLIANGGFEANSQQLAGWLTSGPITPTLSTEAVHSGQFGARLGSANPVTTTGEVSAISQQVTLPVTLTNPTLSLFYQLENSEAQGGGWFDIRASNGISNSVVFTTTAGTSSPVHRWFDLSAWSGQTITLTLATHQAAGAAGLMVYLDEISMGSSYPDGWVTIENQEPTVVPGGAAHYTINYANSGGVVAPGGVITVTLPTGLVYESASVTPLQEGNILTWEIGDLPAGSSSQMIELTVRAAGPAAAASILVTQAEIGIKGIELEQENNRSQDSIFFGEHIFIPTTIK